MVCIDSYNKEGKEFIVQKDANTKKLNVNLM